MPPITCTAPASLYETLSEISSDCMYEFLLVIPDLITHACPQEKQTNIHATYCHLVPGAHAHFNRHTLTSPHPLFARSLYSQTYLLQQEIKAQLIVS